MPSHKKSAKKGGFSIFGSKRTVEQIDKEIAVLQDEKKKLAAAPAEPAAATPAAASPAAATPAAAPAKSGSWFSFGSGGKKSKKGGKKSKKSTTSKRRR
jgi:hypothetical protein